MDYFNRRINNLKILGYLLQLALFIRAVILTGSMTTGTATKDSDIDLLIISKPGRLYTARFFATILALLSGKKRTVFDKNPAGKFCLNYSLSSDMLNIKPHDSRCANFHRYIINIWDCEGIYERIMRENFWLRRFPVIIGNKNDVLLLKKTFPIRKLIALTAIRKIGELILGGWFGNFVESRQFAWQKKIIQSRKMFKMDKYRFVITRRELRLHPKKLR